VGAGGGSIAWIDPGGLLRVGPRSAGADPGPVCYGKSEQLTVTDANLWLGRIPDRLLGGRILLDRKRTDKHLRILADRLSMSPEQCALGIVRIVNAGMTKAVRAVSVERGYNPKDFALFCYGGASGVHCCELAGELGIAGIVVPARAGILSAQGMVLAAPSLDFSKALFLQNPSHETKELQRAMQELEKKARQQAHDLGLAAEPIVERFIDLRYRGQSYELTIPYVADFTTHFHQQHERHFGYSMEDGETEAVSIRLTVRTDIARPELPALPEGPERRPEATAKRDVCFADGRFHVINVYERRSLLPNDRITGPALIIDDYTTILHTDKFDLTVDRQLNLRMNAVG